MLWRLLGAEAEDAYPSEKMAVFEADYGQNSLGAAAPRLSHAAHGKGARREHERHAVKHLVAAAGTAACAVNRRLHGRCFAAREPLSTLLQPA